MFLKNDFDWKIEKNKSNLYIQGSFCISYQMPWQSNLKPMSSLKYDHWCSPGQFLDN